MWLILQSSRNHRYEPIAVKEFANSVAEVTLSGEHD
jgi:hypothetical protein